MRYAAVLFLLGALAAEAGELAPRRIVAPNGNAAEGIGVWSDRTLAVGIEVDRDGARFITSRVKDRPFTHPLALEPIRPYAEGRPVQIEVVLLGPLEQQLTRRLDVQGLCLDHAATEPAHIEGDTIRLHREAFVVELPELEDFDRVEVAYYSADTEGPTRRVLANVKLEQGSVAPTAATVLWPEDFGDDVQYLVDGSEAEGNRRINVVVVPDGYRYADKALMESHFADMVAYFRATRPFTEHDPFMNYILVYAYSVASGTDQCDCDIVLNTAMGTGFPESVPTCGDSANRCLYYGSPCDTNGNQNIVAAELRAPFHDTTVMMVNTERYGGCGGQRAVYSAGFPGASDIAVHELGHSLAGLADEYAGNPGCGPGAGEINTSTHANGGAWPEWIADIGAPRVGAQYYNQCVYRPLPNCEMRALFVEFCPVCNQRWSLITFGHPNVAPSAPVEGFSPGQAVGTAPWTPVDFSVETRLSVGANVTNSVQWELETPSGTTTVVGGGTTSHSQTFTVEGLNKLRAIVVADTNFVKPQKYGTNRDTVTWNVTVQSTAPPGEVSPVSSATPLIFETKARLSWEPGSVNGAVKFNVYSGTIPSLTGGSYGSCLASNVVANHFDVLALVPPGSGRFYLVTGENSQGEGTMGTDSAGATRLPAVACP